MKYIRIRWLHNNPDDPIWIISEIDDDRWETRKVELYADGSKGYADRNNESGGTFLGLVPLPPTEDITSNPQFIPEEIAKEQFEAIWNVPTRLREPKQHMP